MSAIAALILLFQAAAPGGGAKPIIDNERVTVWDLTAAQPMPDAVAHHSYDVVRISISPGSGTAVFEPKSTAHDSKAARTIWIALKDHTVPALPNTSGHPNAFPRPGVKKIVENERVLVWDYAWKPGTPTPMHFHDKDVVVVYLDDGTLESTTPDGQKVLNDYTFGLAKYNPRNRTHTELLVKGSQHAIMMELK